MPRKVMLVVVLVVACVASTVVAGRGEPGDPTDARITQLIERLGAEQYATREKAQAELLRIGVAAFDSLAEAQDHPDVEIAMRVKYLLGSLHMSWTRDRDPQEVQQILRNYGTSDYHNRKGALEQLAALTPKVGCEPLVRVVRFEPNERLSKQAALLLMRRAKSSDESARRELVKTLRDGCAGSRRVASDWVRAHVDRLVDPVAAVETWDAIVRGELETYETHPERTAREITRELILLDAELLLELRRDEAASRTIDRMFDLVEGRANELEGVCSWLLQLGAHQKVDDLAARFPREFTRHDRLGYFRAESLRTRGKTDEAEAIAEAAFAIAAEQAADHYESARWLQQRGLFRWAEREYRKVIEVERPNGWQIAGLTARNALAEMLHDEQNELGAAEALQDFAEAVLKGDDGAKTIVDNVSFSKELVSRHFFFLAQHHAAQQQREAQIAAIFKGLEINPQDVDLLIAKYRVPDQDAAWRSDVSARIKAVADEFRQTILQLDRQPNRQDDQAQIAMQSNLLAWLVSNTEGDFDEALRASQRSLKINPKSAACMDTLGRCYYAKGDYENAIATQRRALEKEPFSGQMKRQLELFEKALADSRSSK